MSYGFYYSKRQDVDRGTAFMGTNVIVARAHMEIPEMMLTVCAFHRRRSLPCSSGSLQTVSIL